MVKYSKQKVLKDKISGLQIHFSFFCLHSKPKAQVAAHFLIKIVTICFMLKLR